MKFERMTAMFGLLALMACGDSDGVFTDPDACVSGNLAAGRTYTKSVSPTAPYTDVDDKEFTDGKKAGHFANDASSFGFQHGANTLAVNVDVDLGSALRFNVVRLNSGAAIDRYTAAALNVLASNDKQTWIPVTRVENPGSLFDLWADFDSIRARYVRFNVEARTGCVDCDWLFLAEGEVQCR